MPALPNQFWKAPLAVVCLLLMLFETAVAQTGLTIAVVEGDNARNVVQQIPARQIRVRVTDGRNQPVAGATVEFRAPATGPSGNFGNDQSVITVTTNTQGMASAGIYHPNSVDGPYQIRISAQYQGMTSVTAIQQTNIVQSSGRRGRWFAVGAIAAGAAAAILAFRGKDEDPSGSGPQTPTITFGGSAVGAPR